MPPSSTCARRRHRVHMSSTKTFAMLHERRFHSVLRRSGSPSATRSAQGTSSSACASLSRWSCRCSCDRRMVRPPPLMSGSHADSSGTRRTASHQSGSVRASMRQMNSPITRSAPLTLSIVSRSAGRSSRGSITVATLTSHVTQRRAVRASRTLIPQRSRPLRRGLLRRLLAPIAPRLPS